jgi:hypothetical protein
MPHRHRPLFVLALALGVPLSGCFGKILSQRSEFGDGEFYGETPTSQSALPLGSSTIDGSDAREARDGADRDGADGSFDGPRQPPPQDATLDASSDVALQPDAACSTQRKSPATTCSLGFGAPKTPLRIQVRAPCTTPDVEYTCNLKADQVSQRLLVSLVPKTCAPVSPATCTGRVVECDVPPLSPNIYSIYFEGDGSNPLGAPNPRVVFYVDEDGTETTCALPAPGQGYEVDLGTAPKDCTTNNDCLVVHQGDLCAMCPESTAVARSALPLVDAAQRQALSRCEYTPGKGYKYCAQFRPVCNAQHKCEAEPAPPL